MAFVKRKYTCSECAKTFKNAEDMHMHAEACLLDAFEMEAHALIMNQGYPSSNTESNNVGKLAMTSNDYQALFKPYTDQKKTRPQRNTLRGSGQSFDAVDELEFEDDYDSDCPPELELAEPQHKKYRRIFPVGEDGKQIRPKMECPTCGLVLYRHNFSTHYRIHTGELPFTCSFCEKRFRTSSALTVHTRCHTGDKPYMCPHCDYSCITKRNLDRHIINNHVKRRRVYVDSNGVAVAGPPRRRHRFFYSSEPVADEDNGGDTEEVDEELDERFLNEQDGDEEEEELGEMEMAPPIALEREDDDE